MPTINGLTERQVEMLDMMWNVLDTEEEYLNWYENLEADEQRQADLLQRMVIMSMVDEEMAEMTSFPDARRVIQQILDRPAI